MKTGTKKKTAAKVAKKKTAAKVAATKRGRGRPPMAPEERADVTIHVRFTAAEIDALDAHLAKLRRRASVGTTVTRTSLVRGLVLAEIGLADKGGA